MKFNHFLFEKNFGTYSGPILREKSTNTRELTNKIESY